MLDASSGTGIEGVTVELVTQAIPFDETVTDAAGKFRFDGLSAGDYALRYKSPKYFLTEASQPVHAVVGHTVQLETRLLAWSVLSGRVVDTRGKPVAHARLELSGRGLTVKGRIYHRTSWGGAGDAPLSDAPSRFTSPGTADAHGAFEVRVTPGAYELSVLPSPGALPPEATPDGPPLAWRRSDPLRVSVLPGSAIAGLELKLLAVPAFAIRGRLHNPDGSPASGADIVLEDQPDPVKAKSRSDGAFELPGVPRGQWCLSAQSGKARVARWIKVSDQDVEGLRFDLAEPVPIQFQVKIEGSAPTTPPDFGPILLKMVNAADPAPDAVSPFALLLVPAGDAGYSAKAAYPGRYTLASRPRPPAPPFYLASLQAAGVDLLRADGEIGFGGELTIIYRTDSGSVRGSVENCGSGGVLLIPRDPALRGRGRSRAVECDRGGSYEIAAVPPGEYAVLALAGHTPVPAMDDSVLQQAVNITVRPGVPASLNLRSTIFPIY